MPRPCSICSRADRSDIDSLVAAGRPGLRAVSKRFGVSIAALSRHGASHLPQQAESPSPEALALSCELCVALNSYLSTRPETSLAVVRDACAILVRAAAEALA